MAVFNIPEQDLETRRRIDDMRDELFQARTIIKEFSRIKSILNIAVHEKGFRDARIIRIEITEEAYASGLTFEDLLRNANWEAFPKGDGE